jgi:hypothetical protein
VRVCRTLPCPRFQVVRHFEQLLPLIVARRVLRRFTAIARMLGIYFSSCFTARVPQRRFRTIRVTGDESKRGVETPLVAWVFFAVGHRIVRIGKPR